MGLELVSSEVPNRNLRCLWAYGSSLKWFCIYLCFIYLFIHFFKIGIHVVHAALKLTLLLRLASNS